MSEDFEITITLEQLADIRLLAELAVELAMAADIDACNRVDTLLIKLREVLA